MGKMLEPCGPSQGMFRCIWEEAVDALGWADGSYFGPGFLCIR